MPASEPLLPIPGRIVTLGQFIIDSFAFSSSTQTQAEQVSSLDLSGSGLLPYAPCSLPFLVPRSEEVAPTPS